MRSVVVVAKAARVGLGFRIWEQGPRHSRSAQRACSAAMEAQAGTY